MLLSIIITIFIGIYVLWVIYHKIQDIRSGKYCSGNCEGCLKTCSFEKDE